MHMNMSCCASQLATQCDASKLPVWKSIWVGALTRMKTLSTNYTISSANASILANPDDFYSFFIGKYVVHVVLLGQEMIGAESSNYAV